MEKLVFQLMGCLLLLFYYGDTTSGTTEVVDDTASKITVGLPAPTFALPNLKGEQVFLRDYCGEKLRKPWQNKVKHVVVLSFFASWCKPCKKEIPILHELYMPFKDRPLKVFLINEQDDKKEVREIVEKEGYTLPVILDMYGVAAKNYDLVDKNDAIGLPRLFVIDKQGIIRMVNRGFKGQEDAFKKDLAEMLEKLLKE